MSVISPAKGAAAGAAKPVTPQPGTPKPVAPPPSVGLGCWTILDEASDEVRATVTREREAYTVRNEHGKVLGKYPTALLALASVG